MLRRIAPVALLTLACVRPVGAEPAAPSASSSATPSPSSTPQWANAAALDREACIAAVAEMKTNGAKITLHPVQKKPNKQGCGMPQPVTVTRGPTGITWSPALVIDCSLAAELPAIEAIVQEEAERSLGAPVKRIDDLGSYACRPSKGPATRAWAGHAVLSEHAFGLAMDLRAFVPRKGRTVTVAKDWNGDDARGAFLAALRRRLKSETAITHVVTPDHDPTHHDHLHVDRGLSWGWWWNGSSPRPDAPSASSGSTTHRSRRPRAPRSR